MMKVLSRWLGVRKRQKPKPLQFRPGVEELESRQLLATFTWTGASDVNGSWDRSANWNQGGAIPGEDDDVVLKIPNADARQPFIAAGTTVQIRSLKTEAGAGGDVTLTVNGTLKVWERNATQPASLWDGNHSIEGTGTVSIYTLHDRGFNFAGGGFYVSTMYICGGNIEFTAAGPGFAGSEVHIGKRDATTLRTTLVYLRGSMTGPFSIERGTDFNLHGDGDTLSYMYVEGDHLFTNWGTIHNRGGRVRREAVDINPVTANGHFINEDEHSKFILASASKITFNPQLVGGVAFRQTAGETDLSSGTTLGALGSIVFEGVRSSRAAADWKLPRALRSRAPRPGRSTASSAPTTRRP